MYCALARVDLVVEDAARPSQLVAVQTDHRSHAELEAEPELAVLFALTRVLNARRHLADEGVADADVRYAMTEPPPAAIREALTAVGAVLDLDGHRERLGPVSAARAGELADQAFAALARRAASRVGTRDLAMALRMLEDQTHAAPPSDDDVLGYWQRVLELGALTGELLRVRRPTIARWVQTDRSVIPFGFELATDDGATVMFPTNRAQRVIDDGVSLFTLVIATEEALAQPPDAATGRLMPSLRAHDTIDLDDVIWRPLAAHVGDGARAALPFVVCGVDGETTFGMMRKAALERSADDAFADALDNLTDEPVTRELVRVDGTPIVAIGGSYYAAEKLLDPAFMRTLHVELGARELAAAAPARGVLLVTSADDQRGLARFEQVARRRFDDSGGRAISPTVLIVVDGLIDGYLATARPETAPVRAETKRDAPRRPGLLRRLFGK